MRSVGAADALSDGPLIAFEMNGRPLLKEHGAPVRLVMPGWYAMASVKWIDRIEARAEGFVGHFQTDRYIYRRAGEADVPVREMRVKSAIAFPAANSVVANGPVKVRGWAWSGSGEITGVEISVSTEGGWRPARLLPSAGRYAWRAFEYDWTPSIAGHHVLRSRATDASGATQPERAEWNALGYGNNSIRCVSVNVR